MSILRSTAFTVFAVISSFLIFALPPVQFMEKSLAADCVKKACINVFTQDGQIVIEGKKGIKAKHLPAPIKSAKVVPPPRPRKISKPQPAFTVNPSQTRRTAVIAPKRVRIIPKKILKRPPIRQVASGTSLNDRLIKLLPVAKIGHAPKVQAIINVPMIFWCDLPTQFVAKISIVGEVVDIAMRPAFFWSFGDGAVLLTTSAGGDYPQANISHTYRQPGRYPVTLVATWGGVWSLDGFTRSFPGQVRQITVALVEVQSAPTIITR